MSLHNSLTKANVEKDVENSYRNEILINTSKEAAITSPYNSDGLLVAKNVRTLLEFKYDDNLKSKLSQCNILAQCLFYIKKFEEAGDKLPTTIFVGDKNECFALHSNSIVKYLNKDIDWKTAPSSAGKNNPDLVKAMVEDIDILPFIFDVDEAFDIKQALLKIKDLSDNIIRKVRLTKHNIVSIFDYFDKNVLTDINLTTNEKANLFIQLIINPGSNYLHPKKKHVLTTESFGDIKVNSEQFKSFFQHFEGGVYSPKEKEEMTGLVDRLILDTVRRSKGEFFTPTAFVDLSHKYLSDKFGEDWKERYIVWDAAAGTSNLTRDYRFKELYISTLEQSDIDTANQMGYNREATKFQFDFLNDSDDKLPQGLQDAITSGKEIIFLINPPYARAGNTDKNSAGIGSADTITGIEMKAAKWGACSANLYAQFLYKITKYQGSNKNINIGIFCNPIYMSGSTYKIFRKKFLNNFGYEKGFLFQASHFSDVSTQWGINFAVFSNITNSIKESFIHDLVDFNEDGFELGVTGNKVIYNTDSVNKLSDWTKGGVINNKVDRPQLTSAVKVKNKKGDSINENSFGSFMNKMNSVYVNQTNVAIFTSATSTGNGGVPYDETNFDKVCTTFTARKVIKGDWVNDKDEYLAPNEDHPEYEQFTIDSLVYSLFNNSSQQSSLRQVDYKDQKWDIKNEFFWLSRHEMMGLANANSMDNLYTDAKNSDDRFVYNKLFVKGLYQKISPDARKVLDMATDLLRKSMSMRQVVSDNHSEFHLESWDAGYAQLKLVWKDYFKEEFKAFRDAYKELEDRMRPLVYELGFLKN